MPCFPSFYHPTEHHLSLVTRLPCIHYFFSIDTILEAYNEIIDERGIEAEWYRRKHNFCQPWERGHTTNGTTLRQFRRYFKDQDWEIVLQSQLPVGSIGRNMVKKKWFKVTSCLLKPLTEIPGMQELFIHRITYILKKK